MIQMVIKQVMTNVLEIFTPKWACEKRLDKLKQDFEECQIENFTENKQYLNKTKRGNEETKFVEIDDKLSYESKDHG